MLVTHKLKGKIQCIENVYFDQTKTILFRLRISLLFATISKINLMIKLSLNKDMYCRSSVCFRKNALKHE